MKNLSPSFNKEWLENKFKFSFGGGSSAPAPAPEKPKKSEVEIEADANRDKNLREEKYLAKKKESKGRKRRTGRSILIAKGNDETGLKDTLG